MNLDQIVDTITASKQEYNLKPYFSTSLNDIDSIKYRHAVLQDLENSDLFERLRSFAQKMRTMREHLARTNKLYYRYQKERWFLGAVEIYCDTVNCLASDLSLAGIRSCGFLAFREYLPEYAVSGRFTSLLAETKKLRADLAAVKYCLLIKGNGIKVRRYEIEADYSAEIEKTFERFRQGDVKDYRAKFSTAGLSFCYPQLSHNKNNHHQGCFDLALAYKLINKNGCVVCNDYHLRGKERIFVVSGPNQGGKTTFARTFGQLYYLASIGCPVPGREARLFLFDRLFTHFEREETIKNLRGKLQDDLVRIHEILNQATSNSIIIMNEIFTSTTLQDAVALSEKVMEKIVALEA